MIRGIERWVATTEAVRESLIAYGIASKKIVAIPNGVDLMGPKTVHREREVALRFLYLGRLSTNIQRDIPTLIKAFDRVADKLSKVELALVGDGDLFQETARLVELARNRARIRMPGLQEPAPWLSWADCLVLPSRREGLSNSLLEGMAHGLACIANDIPQNREVLDCGRAGVLVPVGDEDHLVNELLRMATEPGFAEAVGKSAMQQVGRKYSIEQVAGKYVKLYEELMKI
jgi:glycosyltransferase involved in cell wall biosynthesis